MRTTRPSRSWRSFPTRDRTNIAAQLMVGEGVSCPRCGGVLEANPRTRMAAVLPGVRGHDLDCRGCRQFHPVLDHSPVSLYYLRIRRLAAAVLRS